MTKPLGRLLFVAVASACARPNTAQTRGVIANAGGMVVTSVDCPSQRPPSKFRVLFGSADATLEAQTGTLIFEVRIDSMPGLESAQVSLRNQTIRRDIAYGDSVIRVTVPAGRYLLRARRIGAQTLQDSIDVRSGFDDTVRVTLGRECVYLETKAPIP
jgi:hypothetical protein